MRRKDFLSIDQLSVEELEGLIALSLEFKQHPFSAPELLSNRTLALLFQKPSLRTRVTMTIGVRGTAFDLAVRAGSGESMMVVHEGGTNVCDREQRCLEVGTGNKRIEFRNTRKRPGAPAAATGVEV